MAGPFQHIVDQRFCRENYGQEIGPAVIQKQLLQLFRSIGKGRRTFIANDVPGLLFFRRQRLGEFIDDLLHHRLAGDRVVAVDDVSAQLLARLCPYRTTDPLGPQTWQSFVPGFFCFLLVEFRKNDRNRRDIHLGFKIDGVADNCRRTLASMAQSDDDAIGLFLHLRPQGRILRLQIPRRLFS